MRKTRTVTLLEVYWVCGSVWLGLTIANFLYAWVDGQTMMRAFERVFFQGVALGVVAIALTVAIRSHKLPNQNDKE